MNEENNESQRKPHLHPSAFFCFVILEGVSTVQTDGEDIPLSRKSGSGFSNMYIGHCGKKGGIKLEVCSIVVDPNIGLFMKQTEVLMLMTTVYISKLNISYSV